MDQVHIKLEVRPRPVAGIPGGRVCEGTFTINDQLDGVAACNYDTFQHETDEGCCGIEVPNNMSDRELLLYTRRKVLGYIFTLTGWFDPTAVSMEIWVDGVKTDVGDYGGTVVQGW